MSRRSFLYRHWPLALLGVVLVPLVFYNLEYYPHTWFDEGWHLQIPKNLVQYGEYATLSSEGFRTYDMAVGISPVFFLPIAAAFRICGIGLFQARVVIAAYFPLTCLIIYIVAKSLYGSRPALIALALFILVQADDYSTSALLLGRQVMGEIPALCFFMAAIYFWLTSFERKTNAFLVLSGALFGVAMGIKAVFLLNVPAMIVVLGVIDRLYYGQRRYRYYVLPLATSFGVMLFHYAFLLIVLGTDDFLRYLSLLSAGSGSTVSVLFLPVAMLTGLRFFLRSGYFVWVAPGLVYGVFLSTRKKPGNIKLCLPWVFVAGWLVWFLVASTGWARYAFPALAVSYLLVAKLFDDLAGASALSLRKVRIALRNGEVAPVARTVSVFLLLGMLLLNSSRQVIKGIFSTPDRSAQEFAAYIDAHIDQDELIETSEWEIAFLANDHIYHHLPTSLMPSLIAYGSLGAPYDPQVYDFQQYEPAYVVIGWFAKWTGLYPPVFLEQECTLVKSIGDYDLYRVNASE
jgi:4-amino-4-deoxy-L-arabinose transferase-like glycosyltransferase